MTILSYEVLQFFNHCQNAHSVKSTARTVHFMLQNAVEFHSLLNWLLSVRLGAIGGPCLIISKVNGPYLEMGILSKK